MSPTVNPLTIDLVNSNTMLELVCVVTLVLLLTKKLLAAAGSSRFALMLSLGLNVFLVPLMLAFILIAVARVIELL